MAVKMSAPGTPGWRRIVDNRIRIETIVRGELEMLKQRYGGMDGSDRVLADEANGSTRHSRGRSGSDLRAGAAMRIA